MAVSVAEAGTTAGEAQQDDSPGTPGRPRPAPHGSSRTGSPFDRCCTDLPRRSTDRTAGDTTAAPAQPDLAESRKESFVGGHALRVVHRRDGYKVRPCD